MEKIDEGHACFVRPFSVGMLGVGLTPEVRDLPFFHHHTQYTKAPHTTTHPALVNSFMLRVCLKSGVNNAVDTNHDYF